MAIFTYKAWDIDQVAVTGTLIADTPRQARDSLRHRGLTVHDVTSLDQQAKTSWFSHYRDKRLASKVTEMVRELATLLSVGIPLLDALDTIADRNQLQNSGANSQFHNTHQNQAGRNHFQKVLIALRERVAAGLSLAEAMRQRPRVFDTMTVDLIEVGEHAGNLEQVLEHLANYRQRASQLRGKLGTTLIYPVIVLFAGIAVSVFLMTFVVPNLLQTLIDAGQPLPLATRVVKASSDLLIQGWAPLLLGLLLLAVGLLALLRTRQGRKAWHRLQLRLPLLGELVRKQAIARMSLVLSVLLRGGMTLVQALAIVRRGTRNQVLHDALMRCEQAVISGRDISDAMAQVAVFPPTVVRVLSVGLDSGKLDEMLERLAIDYDRHVSDAAGRLSAALEPILIIVLAALVGFIAFATVMPILQAGHVLG